MSRPLALITALIACAAVAPRMANAADVRAGIMGSGPVLAGEHVLWTEGGGKRVLTVRSAPVAGGAATTIDSTPANPLGQQGRLATSGTAVALEVFSGGPGGGSSVRSVFAGGPNGPLDPLEQNCSASFPYPRTIDVSANSVLFVGCDGRSGTLRDLTTGVDRPVPTGTRGLRLAGHFAAWVEGVAGSHSDSVVVYDLDAEAIKYRIPTAALAKGVVDDLALQFDGKLVIAYPAPAPGKRFSLDRVAWASPDAPTLHTVPLRRARSYRVKLADDRIAFDRSAATKNARIRRDVGVSDFMGNEKLLDTGGDDESLDEHLDFDGRLLAWFSYGCHQAIVHVRNAVDAPTTAHSHRRCPLALKRQPTVRHAGTRLFVDCFGFDGGSCDASDVRLRATGRVVGTGKTFRHVRLNRLGRRLFGARHHRLAVQMTATLKDDAGRRERRRGQTVLRSP